MASTLTFVDFLNVIFMTFNSRYSMVVNVSCDHGFIMVIAQHNSNYRTNPKAVVHVNWTRLSLGILPMQF